MGKNNLDEKISEVVDMIHTDEDEDLVISFMRADETSQKMALNYLSFLLYATDQEQQEVYTNTGIANGVITSNEDVKAMNEAVTQWMALHPDYETRKPNCDLSGERKGVANGKGY